MNSLLVQRCAYALVAAASPLATYATVYNLPPDTPPSSLAAGDTLNVHIGAATVDSLEAGAGSTINVYGGAMGFFTTLSGDLNVYGGKASSFTVASGATIDVFDGASGDLSLSNNSHLTMHGGEIDGFVTAINSTIDVTGGTMHIVSQIRDSTVNLSGGKISLGITPPAISNSIVNVSGGILGDLWIGENSVLNLRGGAVLPQLNFTALPDCTVHLFVRNAMLNGTPISGLSLGSDTAVDVTNLNAQLNGTLQDGSPFNFILSSQHPHDPTILGAVIFTNPDDVQGPRPPDKVEVLITLVPEPASATIVAISILALLGCESSSRRRR